MKLITAVLLIILIPVSVFAVDIGLSQDLSQTKLRLDTNLILSEMSLTTPIDEFSIGAKVGDDLYMANLLVLRRGENGFQFSAVRFGPGLKTRLDAYTLRFELLVENPYWDEARSWTLSPQVVVQFNIDKLWNRIVPVE